MAKTENNQEKLLRQFKRYLNLGYETVETLRNPNELYNLNSLKKLLEQSKNDNAQLVMNAILLINKDGGLLNRRYIINALAYCVCYQNAAAGDGQRNDAAKRLAYSHLNEICKNSFELFYFIKMCEYFNKEHLLTKRQSQTASDTAKQQQQLPAESAALDSSRSDSVLVKTKLLSKRSEVELFKKTSGGGNSRPSSSVSVKSLDAAIKKNDRRTESPSLSHQTTTTTQVQFNNENNQSNLAAENKEVVNAAHDLMKTRKQTPKLSEKFVGSTKIADKKCWNKQHRKAIANWYTSQEPLKLAFDITSCPFKHGWSHLDVLRMAHPKAKSLLHNLIFKYITCGNLKNFKKYFDLIEAAFKQQLTSECNDCVIKLDVEVKISGEKKNSNLKEKNKEKRIKKLTIEYKVDRKEVDTLTNVFKYLEAYERLKKSNDDSAAVPALIKEYQFCLRHIPIRFNRSKFVWLSLLNTKNFDLIDVIKNLLTMAKYRIIPARNDDESLPLTDETDEQIEKAVCEKLKAVDLLKSKCVHPMQIYSVIRLYRHGKPLKRTKAWIGSSKWPINKKVDEMLEDLFDLSFSTFPGSENKLNICLLNNVWKMTRAKLKKNKSATPYQASVLMSKCVLQTEANIKEYTIVAYTLTEMPISKQEKFKQALDKLWSMNTGSASQNHMTIKNALTNGEQYDAFIIYTNMEPYQSESLSKLFEEYVSKMNKPNCKLLFVSLVSNKRRTTQIDTNNLNMLELCGLNANLPRIMNNFLNDLF